MPWPPVVPPNTRSNTTPTVDNHPADHNSLSNALTDLVNLLGTDPAGSYADIQDRLDALEFELRPPGELMDFGGEAKPDGRWLPTNGGEYPRGAPYDRLFLAIGSKWGGGNGTTTFNVPNLAGRTLVATGGSGASATFASLHGSSVGRTAKHTHEMKDHTHVHTHPLLPGAMNSIGAHDHNIGANARWDFRTTTSGLGPQHTLDPGPPANAFWAESALTGGWVATGADGGAHIHTLSGNTGAASTPNKPNDNVTNETGLDPADLNYQPSANITIWVRY